MQRSMVLLPDPLRPITATTSLGSMSSDTPSRTRSAPKYFLIALMCRADMTVPLQTFAQEGHRITDGEVDRGNRQEDVERLERHVVEQLSGTGEFHETDQCDHGCILDDLHH